MGQARRVRRDLPEYAHAMREAWADAHAPGAGDQPAPRPLCDNDPTRYVDYGYPLPSARKAREMCAPCPLLELCAKNARHRQPAWGVWGGIVWVNGRQAHLMARDDPRLQDPDEIVA